MKVLHLIGGGDVGGAKIHVLSLVSALSNNIDIKIISLRQGAFADEAREMGIDIQVIRSGNIVADIKKVLNIIRVEKFELVHSHGAKANMFSFFVKNRTGIPTVTTVHSDYRLDYLHSFVKRYSFGLINTIALRFVDYYTTVSERFRHMLIERKFNPEYIYTVYNGMDFNLPVNYCSREDFLARYGLEYPSDTIIVGILARLNPVKGVSTFIDAAREVLKKNSNIIFLIGGDGEERNSLERKTTRLGIGEKVHFLGWIDNSYDFFNCIDINVLSSLSETFPYSILEGIRMKKVVISTCVGGIPDLIEDGINGYLFEPGDYITLGKKIIELADNPVEKKLMSEIIYEKAAGNFSLEHMCKTQLDIYNSILKIKSSKSSGKKINAIISGYYGFKNVGDDAMLMSIINDLRAFDRDIRLIILSSDPLEMKKNYFINSINRINILRIIKTMRSSQLFIYGGGTLIQESTSTRSLFYYLFIIWIAKKMGLKVMLYANGIEPINKYINRLITQKIMNGVDVITLREKESEEELCRLGINQPKIIVTADPALNMKACENDLVESILKYHQIPDSGPLIGVSARKWDGFRREEELKACNAIAGTLDYMTEKYGMTPVFIPMQFPGDLTILKSIQSLMKHKSYLIDRKYNASETLGITGRMDIVMGMRLHALVFASSLFIPVVGLVYEPKVEAFLKYIGLQNASAGSVKKLDCEKLKELTENIWNQRLSINNLLKKNISALKKKALDNAKYAAQLIGKDNI